MIQSAMMFALGIFVSGLVWLALTVALVRRARRLTERRLLAGMSIRRAEFDIERDELRARHAVEMHRLEREVSRILDMATAHRLEADVKDRDLYALQAEMGERLDELTEAQERVAEQRAQIQELERQNVTTGAELRAVQHALKLEMRRRAVAEEALDEAAILADKRKLENIALRAENDALRAAQPIDEDGTKLPRILLAPERNAEPAVPPLDAATGGSVVPLPMRGRVAAAETPEQAAARVAEAARDLQRLAGEARAELGAGIWRAPAASQPRLLPPSPESGIVADLDARRQAVAASGGGDVEEDAENRFFEALAEIRALKRAASQAGE